MSSLSLKFKVALSAILIGGALLLVQFAWQREVLREDLSRAIETEQFRQLTVLAEQLDEKINERVAALSAVAAQIPLDQLAQPAALEAHLRREAALLTLFNDLYVFAADGRLLVDWPEKPGRRGLDMSGRDYIQGVLTQGRPVISEPILGKATGQPIVVVAVPVRDAEGRLQAILGGVLNLLQRNLIGDLGERRIGESGYYYLTTASRRIIAHPDRTRIMAEPLPAGSNPAFDAAIAGFEGTREGINSRGLAGLFTFRRLHSTGWILASVVPSEEAFAPVGEILGRQALITGVVMLLALPLLWFGSQRLLRPLLDLARAMRERAAGMQPGVAVSPVPVRGSAEIRMAVQAINDFIDARNATEIELSAARHAAEAASQAKTRFLANMSHEIRTPMNGIIGMIDLSLSGATLDAENREFLEIAQRSAYSLLAILNDILDFSKIEAGELELNAAPFDLHRLLQDVCALMVPAAREKGLRLHCELAPGLPRRVIGDSLRLRQVLLNLMANAVKFTQAGEVGLTAVVGEPDPGQAGAAAGGEPANQAAAMAPVRCVFTVRDTGIGIPADRQAQIFSAFTQVDGSTSRRYGGTGLGLTISHRLMTLMGGTLSVDSTEGQGSAFCCTLDLLPSRD